MKITGIATISVDGRITPPDAEGTPFSSPETGENFFSLINSADAVVSGRRTYEVVKDMMIKMTAHSNGEALNVIMTRSPSRYEDPTLPEGFLFTDQEPSELLKSLEQRGVESVLVAGGAQIYAAFAASQLIDEWIIVIEPLLLGGGTPLLASVAEQQLALEESRHLNDSTMLLRYGVKS